MNGVANVHHVHLISFKCCVKIENVESSHLPNIDKDPLHPIPFNPIIPILPIIPIDPTVPTIHVLTYINRMFYHFPMETAKLALCFKALGEPARLRILQRLPLTNNCEDVYNVSELAEELEIPQPTVSHHLKILHQAGLVQCAKMCRDVYYWIEQPAVEEALAALNGLLNEGQAQHTEIAATLNPVNPV